MGLVRYFATIWNSLRTWAVNTVGNISITDVVDMLIIAFLLYKFMQFLRRSRLGLVAKSILLLVVVAWGSGRFNLMVVNFATSRAMEMGILALVILFQQEIRQTLEQIGSKNLSDFVKRSESEEGLELVIVQTVQACLQMAKDRTGALIVLERKVSLEEEVRSGTRLEARVTALLIANIFHNKAPLHDGAMIIRGGRIESAGCILPLSDNANLSRELGTRHRAGIGVSEKSDAVVVAVSEETGAISVAVNGHLRRHLTQETLERLLRNELLAGTAPEVSKISSLKSWLTGGWHEKKD